MEETHQEVLLKVREDMKRDEEKHISRAVAEVRSEEEEKQHEMIQEMKQKERERIQAAVDAERRIMESQHGSVTQLQQVRRMTAASSVTALVSFYWSLGIYSIALLKTGESFTEDLTRANTRPLPPSKTFHYKTWLRAGLHFLFTKLVS